MREREMGGGEVGGGQGETDGERGGVRETEGRLGWRDGGRERKREL